MPSLEATIQDSIRAAMKGGRKDELEVLRTLMAEAKNAAIRDGLERSGIPDEVMLPVLRRAVKQRDEARDAARQAGRDDLIQRETLRGDMLRRYLPAQAPPERIEAVVDEVIAELGATDKKSMGPVIQQTLARLQGAADGGTVSRIVAARLG